MVYENGSTVGCFFRLGVKCLEIGETARIGIVKVKKKKNYFENTKHFLLSPEMKTACEKFETR